jgi:hypothetical protein
LTGSPSLSVLPDKGALNREVAMARVEGDGWPVDHDRVTMM